MAVKEGQLLRAVRGIIGRIQVDRDDGGAAVQPAAMAFDHTIGQRFAHPVKLFAVGSILETADRRLRGQVLAFNGIAPDQHLVHGVFGQPRRIIGIRITAGDAEDTLRQQFFHLMIHFARLPLILQADRQRLSQLNPAISRFQQDCSAVGTPLPLVKLRDHRLRKNIGKQQTLCCAILGLPEASSIGSNPHEHRVSTTGGFLCL